MNLTQKERLLLEDQKKHEEICIQKYTNSANQAQDQQLKQLFNNHAQHERQHLNTINQILAGQVPITQSQGQQQGQQQPGMVAQPVMGQANANDAVMCNDLLMAEKYVSGAYDTAIFEMTNTNVRQALNHIQKEEQQHGEDLFNYLNSQGMYNLQ